ncbi:hypothetical protein GH714_013694 [Hevea brasiliensis]|uniref:DOG1 domain-containing protein n=1 Tax=Hevea brasiliensis TaxID=3981 RepID=A0A6A6LRE9_HEVBR|nr:hypothetical protein GH714_013694 [Hevea brasiliensis]
MKAVDCVRLKTLKGVLDVLSPLQCVEFLAGIGMLQILLRQWGKKRVEREMERQQVDCSRQENGRVGKVGGSSEEWEGSEEGGGVGAGGTERSNGRTRKGDESGRLSKA